MKKSVLLLCLILSAISVFGQFKFGAKAGLNISGASYTAPSGSKEPKIESKNGFYIGGTVEYPFNENLSFLSGLCFTGRGFKAKSESDASSENSANYIDLPLTMKYNYNISGYNVYGVGGLLVGFKVSESNSTSTGTETRGGLTIVSKSNGNSIEAVNSTSAENSSSEDYFETSLYAISLGIGVDIPVFSFTVAPEISYNFGLNKVNKPEGSGETKLRDLMLGVAFKF